jgi:outer membrane lipoprotein-sorting protein
MRVSATTPSYSFFLAALLALSVFASACQNTPVSNTGNANTATTNTTTTNTSTTVAVDPGTVINTREPESYRATLVFTAETEGGDKAIAVPPISAEVARSGADRRVSFKLPNNEQLIYLDSKGKHYVISPDRKQYAELTAQATGFEIQRLMTPGQLVSYLEKQKGYERVGEEPMNGRTAEKYRYAGTAKTGTQAGDIKSEAFVYVDKETGLPLRAELYSEATGNVQGARGAKVVAEMRDIQTTVEPTLFEVPTGLKQVTPDQVRQQIDALTATVAAVVRALLSNMGSPQSSSTTTVTTTTTMASPSPSVSPSVTP